MSFRIICGPTGSGKTRKAMAAFLEALKRGVRPVYIAPSSPDARHFERGLLELLEERTLCGGAATTFDGLCDQLLADSGMPPCLGEAQRRLLLRLIVDSSELSYLRESAVYPGFVLALERLITELKETGIDPEHFGKAASGILPRDLNADIYRLFRGYEDALIDQGLVDTQQLRRKALNRLRQNPSLFPYELVVVDGFWDFTFFEQELLGEIARAGLDLIVTMPFVDGRAVYTAPGIHLAQLKAGAEVEFLRPPAKNKRHPALVYVDEHLFEDGVEPILPGDALGLLEGAGVRGQAELVAAEILRLWRQEGIELDNMAVICRNQGADTAAITSVFSDFGIPYDYPAPLSLADTALGQAVMAALGFVEAWLGAEAYPHAARDSLLAFLGNALSPVGRERADDFARQVGLQKIDGAAALLDKWLEFGGGDLSLLVALKEAAATGTKALACQLNTLARDLVSRVHVRKGGCSQDEKKEDLLALKTLLEVCTALSTAADSTENSQDGVSGIRLLKDGIRTANISDLSGNSRGCVRVLDPHRVLNQSFDVIFLCGLLEGQFPALGREDPFLPDVARTRLVAERGLLLKTNEYRLDQERFLFHRTLSRARKRVYLCYPYCNQEGKETVRSLFVEETLDLFERLDPILHRRKLISEVTFKPAEVPTKRQALNSLCLIAGEMIPYGKDSLPKQFVKKLMETAAAAGINDEFDACLKAVKQPAFGIFDESLLAIFKSITSYSASDLEKYAGCPYQYFVDKWLRPALMEEDIYWREMGSIAHRILSKFGRLVRNAGDLGSSSDKLDAALEVMDQLLAEECQAFGSDYQSLKMKAELHYYLRQFVKDEAKAATGLKPKLFECSFDQRGKNNGWQQICAELNLGDGLTLKGRMDRVDIEEGEAERPRAIVIDYKMSTSVSGVLKFKDKGLLQIPLYILALQNIWHLNPVGGYYYGLRQGKNNPRRGMFNMDEAGCFGRLKVSEKDRLSPEEFEAELADALNRARLAAQKIQAGDFAPAPREGACEYCDYDPLCRHQK